MSGGRSHAYLDLTALPEVGAALVSERPTVLWSADGRSALWANAAGGRFLGETSMASLLERRFSASLPSAAQIARFARAVPAGASRLERIRFADGARFSSLAARCTRLALGDGTPAVLVAIEPPGRAPTSRAELARELVELLAADDYLVAILGEDGEVLAERGGFETLAAGEAAIEDMIERVAGGPDRIVKRAIRIGDVRRAAGMVHVRSEEEGLYLLVVGPAERIIVETAPVPARAAVDLPVASASAAEASASSTAPEPDPEVPAEAVSPADAESADAESGGPAPDPAEGDSGTGAETGPPPPIAGAGPSPAEPEPPIEADHPEPALEPAAAVAGEASLEAQAAPAEPVAETPDSSEASSSFRFVPPRGPTRFVFQMDAEGRFTFVSPDLSAVVGPRSAAISGLAWRDVARERGLDADGKVAAIIARRDTWSGVSLVWPVDDSEERVAVDLAALPAFSRDRAFEGYRGFGVIRPLDRRRDTPRPESDAPPTRLVGPVWPAEPDAPPTGSPQKDGMQARGDERAAEANGQPSVEAPPSNVVQLPRTPAPTDPERLTVPERDAFRRIAVALGAKPVEAKAPAGEPAAIAPAVAESDEAPVAQPDRPVAIPASDGPEPPAPPQDMAPGVDAPPVDETAPDHVATPAAAASPSGEPESDVAAAELAAPSAASDEAPERLAAAEQKVVELEAILDTATDGVVVVDGEGRIERLNRSAEALFGVSTGEVAGTPFAGLFAEESRKSALDYLDGLARNGVASVLNDGREVIGRVPQGGLIPLFMTMGRLAGTERFCAVLRDITQWKNAEEELINARRAAENASMQKSDFLAKVSHEIRTPLNAIIGFSEVMMEERFGPVGTERYKEYLRDIHLSGAHLMSLLNDLLDLSKIEAGKMDLAFEAVALNDLVMECVALMQPQANRERIIIRTSLSGQVPSVVADQRSIRQIVLNLVSNAVKFTLAGGQVIVSTVLEESGEVTLRIRDTGIGMSEKDIETALKPFRQLSASSKPRSDGTGLGLPLTKALVEANRAAFVIDSTVGQGTLIRITFPATRVLAS